MRGSLLRTGARALAMLLLGLLSVAPAVAGETNVSLTGSLTITWRGDPARGCAATSQCGVSGALEVVPSGESGSSSGIPIELQDGSAAARVTERAADGTVTSTCADLVPVDLSFALRHVRGRLRAVSTGFFEPPSAGRCAGPTVRTCHRSTCRRAASTPICTSWAEPRPSARDRSRSPSSPPSGRSSPPGSRQPVPRCARLPLGRQRSVAIAGAEGASGPRRNRRIRLPDRRDPRNPDHHLHRRLVARVPGRRRLRGGRTDHRVIRRARGDHVCRIPYGEAPHRGRRGAR